MSDPSRRPPGLDDDSLDDPDDDDLDDDDIADEAEVGSPGAADAIWSDGERSPGGAALLDDLGLAEPVESSGLADGGRLDPDGLDVQDLDGHDELDALDDLGDDALVGRLVDPQGGSFSDDEADAIAVIGDDGGEGGDDLSAEEAAVHLTADPPFDDLEGGYGAPPGRA